MLVDFKNTVILPISKNRLIERVARSRQNQWRRGGVLAGFSWAAGGGALLPVGGGGGPEDREAQAQGIQERIRESHMAELTFDPELVDSLAAKCTEADTGAREIEHILTQTFLPELSGRILERMAAGRSLSRCMFRWMRWGGLCE